MSKNKLINIIKCTNSNRLIDVAIISSNDTRNITYSSIENNSYKQENNILGAYYYYLADYYLIRD
jgi:hypothetical protein